MSLFNLGTFVLSSGQTSTFKIDCDALTDADWAALARSAAGSLPPFSSVVSVPTGGDRFAKALEAYAGDDYGQNRTLIVDDVLTTGASMERAREATTGRSLGVVAFARNKPPPWILAVFKMEVYA